MTPDQRSPPPATPAGKPHHRKTKAAPKAALAASAALTITITTSDDEGDDDDISTPAAGHLKDDEDDDDASSTEALTKTKKRWVLFLLASPHKDRHSHILIAPNVFSEKATNIGQDLVAYVEHHCGVNVLRFWFTADAIEGSRMNEEYWDDDCKEVVTHHGKAMKGNATEQHWWETDDMANIDDVVPDCPRMIYSLIRQLPIASLMLATPWRQPE
jgi:hypothetical protein